MARFGIGQAVRRVEDERFLKGAGNYVGDYRPAGRARTASSSTPRRPMPGSSASMPSKAQAAPGRRAGADRRRCHRRQDRRLAPAAMPEDIGGPEELPHHRPVLVPDEVRCVGDRVAFVVAETEAAGARRGRADRDRLRDAPRRRLARGRRQAGRAGGVGRLPGQRLLQGRLRRRGGHQRRLRRGPARRLGQARQQPRVGQLHGGTRLDRPVRCRGATSTRSTPARRTRSASG